MMMEPKITITSEESNVLNFTLSDTHFSLANSLRRIVLSEIPTLVFRAFPHSESKIDIISNTTRLNNEIIKQRIGCIPIHITDVDFPYKEYVVEVREISRNFYIIKILLWKTKLHHISGSICVVPSNRI